MFFLLINGEGTKPKEEYEEIGRKFQQGFQEIFNNSLPKCIFTKVKKKKTFICNKVSVTGTCYCKKHFASERKIFIRSYYESNSMIISRDCPILDILNEHFHDSWKKFSEVLKNGLNTLSMNIQFGGNGNEIDLVNLAQIMREHNDAVSFTKVKKIINVKNSSNAPSGIAFNNVIEFIVLQEHGITGETINASVKIWHNKQIHICGCRTISCAFRLVSCVLRVLYRYGVLDINDPILSIRPVFANASFQYFEHPIIIREIEKQHFCGIIQKHLNLLSNSNEFQVYHDQNTSGCKRTACAIFYFKSKECSTAAKLYPRGNFIVTTNNFHGYLLSNAITSIRNAVEETNVYLHTNSLSNVILPKNPLFSYENFLTQIEKTNSRKRKN
jgi:hypothetical protein